MCQIIQYTSEAVSDYGIGDFPFLPLSALFLAIIENRGATFELSRLLCRTCALRCSMRRGSIVWSASAWQLPSVMTVAGRAGPQVGGRSVVPIRVM